MNEDDDYDLCVNSQQQQQEEQQDNSPNVTSSNDNSSRKRRRQQNKQQQQQQRPTNIRRTERYNNLLDTERTSSQQTSSSREIHFDRTRRGEQQPLDIYNERLDVNLYNYGVTSRLHLPHAAHIANAQENLNRIRNNLNNGRRVTFNDALNRVYNPPQFDNNVDEDTDQENINLNNQRQNKYNKL